MSNLIEIRWHGRGGQGAKTASLLLADAAFNTGKYIQGFPEYGPERMGAPITAYNRISSTPITIHSNIYEPDYVVVVDDSLLDVERMVKELSLYKGKSGTSCPSVGSWLDSFEGYDEIYVVTITGKLSGSYNSANAAKSMYLEENPNAKILVIAPNRSVQNNWISEINIFKLSELPESAEKCNSPICRMCD